MDETTAMGGNTSGATAAANNIEGEPVKVEGSTTAADPDLKKEDAAENVEAAKDRIRQVDVGSEGLLRIISALDGVRDGHHCTACAQ